MPAGIFFVVIGGWLLSRWTYSSSAFGLVNGRYVFWLRLNVTSRKLIICLLASMVMRSPLLLKMRHISFLMFSVSLGEALVMASPSSGGNGGLNQMIFLCLLLRRFCELWGVDFMLSE